MTRILLIAFAAWSPAVAIAVLVAIAVVRDRGIADPPDDPELVLTAADLRDLELLDTDPDWIDRLVSS